MMLPLLAVGGVAAAVAYVLSRRRSGKKEPPLYDVNDFDGLEGGGGSPSHGSGRHRRHVHQSTPFDYEPRPQAYAARPASIPFPRGPPAKKLSTATLRLRSSS